MKDLNISNPGATNTDDPVKSPLEGFKSNLRNQAGLEEPTGARCIKCNQPFVFGKPEDANANVFTPEGRRETSITGFCERCYDEIFEEDEN